MTARPIVSIVSDHQAEVLYDPDGEYEAGEVLNLHPSEMPEGLGFGFSIVDPARESRDLDQE